jgi:hypothetical protein
VSPGKALKSTNDGSMPIASTVFFVMHLFHTGEKNVRKNALGARMVPHRTRMS